MRDSLCPVCSIQGVPFLEAKDFNRRISADIFLYLKCPSCGLIYLVNVPEELGKYYPAAFYAIPRDKESLLAKSANEQYKIEIVQQFIKKGRLLEIGSAWGTFACLARQSGFDIDVIEMNEQCCRFIQNKLGIRAVTSIDQITTHDGLSGYDAILLWHVIEHLPDPWSVLKTACAQLLPEGILVVSAPNPEALQFRIFGHHWTHVDAPRHVQLIPISLLTQQMDKLGFQPLLITTTDQGSLKYNSFGWGMSIKTYFRFKPLRFGAYCIGRVLAGLLVPIESKGRRGSCYTAVFRRKGLL